MKSDFTTNGFNVFFSAVSLLSTVALDERDTSDSSDGVSDLTDRFLEASKNMEHKSPKAEFKTLNPKFHWLNNWHRNQFLKSFLPHQTRKCGNVEEITMNNFLAEECEDKETYSVILYPAIKIFGRNSAHYIGSSVGISLATLSDGNVVVAGVNPIREFSSTNENSILQPSPAQINGSISVGDFLLRVNNVSLANLNLMQLTNIISRFEMLLENGLELQFRYGRGALQFVQDNGTEIMAQDSEKKVEQLKNVVQQSSVAKNHTKGFSSYVLGDKLPIMEMTAGETEKSQLQSFYSDFNTYYSVGTSEIEQLVFSDLVQSLIRRNHTYPIAARTSSIAHSRSMDIMLHELASELFEWRPRHLASVYGGYFRQSTFPTLLCSPTDRAIYRYTKVLEWDPQRDAFVYSTGTVSVPVGEEDYRVHKLIIGFDCDEDLISDGNISILFEESSCEDDKDDPEGIFVDVGPEEGSAVYEESSRSFYKIASKTSEDFKKLMNMLNQVLLSRGNNSRPESKDKLLFHSKSMEAFLLSLSQTASSSSLIIRSLFPCLDASERDGNPFQITHALFCSLLIFPESIFQVLEMERLLYKWQLIVEKFYDSMESNPLLNQKGGNLVDLAPFNSICGQLLTLIFVWRVCKDYLILNDSRSFSNDPDKVFTKLNSSIKTLHRTSVEVSIVSGASNLDLLPFEINRQSFSNYLSSESNLSRDDKVRLDAFIDRFGILLSLDTALLACSLQLKKESSQEDYDYVFLLMKAISNQLERNESFKILSVKLVQLCAKKLLIGKRINDELQPTGPQESLSGVTRKITFSAAELLRELQLSLTMPTRSLSSSASERRLPSKSTPIELDGKIVSPILLGVCVLNLKEIFFLNEKITLEICLELSQSLYPVMVKYALFNSLQLSSILQNCKEEDCEGTVESHRAIKVSLLEKYFKYLKSLYESKRFSSWSASLVNMFVSELLEIALFLHLQTLQSASHSSMIVVARQFQERKRNESGDYYLSVASSVIENALHSKHLINDSNNSRLQCASISDCVVICCRYNFVDKIWRLIKVWTQRTHSHGRSAVTSFSSDYKWGSEEVNSVVNQFVESRRYFYGKNIPSFKYQLISMEEAIRSMLVVYYLPSTLVDRCFHSDVLPSYWLILLLLRIINDGVLSIPGSEERILREALADLRKVVEMIFEIDSKSSLENVSESFANTIIVSIFDTLDVNIAIAFWEQIPHATRHFNLPSS